jgi:excisionase family DNA binding protein
MTERLLRNQEAAEYIGVNPETLRRYAKAGKIKYYMLGRERKFSTTDLDKLIGRDPATASDERVEALYVRVSGSTGQETSMKAQKKMLTQTTTGTLYKTYSDKGSGLSTKRKGLHRMLADAKDGKFTVVRVTHPDRLTRFGFEYIEQLLNEYGVSIEMLPGTQVVKTDTEELLEDFMSLVSSFSGRMYGMRSTANKKLLLDQAKERASSD